jgi:hypothetical protein
MRPLLLLCLCLGLAACGGRTNKNLDVPANISLPESATQGTADPVQMAANNVARIFAKPKPAIARPGDAATGIAQMEYLVAALTTDPRFAGLPPGLGPTMVRARQEWRAILGVPQTAPAQAVIDALYTAAPALQAGQKNNAALLLPNRLFTLGGEVTVQHLGALPELPLTSQAAQSIQQAVGGGPARSPAR